MKVETNRTVPGGRSSPSEVNFRRKNFVWCFPPPLKNLPTEMQFPHILIYTIKKNFRVIFLDLVVLIFNFLPSPQNIIVSISKNKVKIISKTNQVSAIIIIIIIYLLPACFDKLSGVKTLRKEKRNNTNNTINTV